MRIISSTTVKQAVSETENANYSIEYTLANDKLLRVLCSIYSLGKDENENNAYVGTISYENEVMNSSLPINSNATDLIAEFEEIILKIKSLEFGEE